MKSFIAASALFVALASAFTNPTNQTYGPLTAPSTSSPVTQGQPFTIQWTPIQPATGVTVSLVLCKGNSNNCVIQSPAIVEGIPAGAGSYNWNVPCNLPVGTQNTDSGYGMLIIVDGTGQFQYSTQFSVLAGNSCGSTTTTTTSSSSSSSSSSTSSSSSSTSSATSSNWYGWSTSSSTTTSTTSTTSRSTSTPLSYITPTPLRTSTTTMVTSSYYSVASSSSSPSAASTTPKTYTGAAAMPTAFMNVAGLVGAAAVGMLAL